DAKDVTVKDPTSPVPPGTLPVSGPGDQTIHAGGAHTHYAFDVSRQGTPLLRVVVTDTSLRSLEASDSQQNPLENQLSWLKDVLSSRPQGERAVVVSNTPSYSYGPGATTDTLTDATAVESLLMP